MFHWGGGGQDSIIGFMQMLKKNRTKQIGLGEREKSGRGFFSQRDGCLSIWRRVSKVSIPMNTDVEINIFAGRRVESSFKTTYLTCVNLS